MTDDDECECVVCRAWPWPRWWPRVSELELARQRLRAAGLFARTPSDPRPPGWLAYTRPRLSAPRSMVPGMTNPETPTHVPTPAEPNVVKRTDETTTTTEYESGDATTPPSDDDDV